LWHHVAVAALRPLFAAHWGGDPRDVVDDVENALAEACAAARSAWDTFAVEDAQFVPYIAARVAASATPARSIAELHAADLYLACACVAQVSEALDAFESYLHGAAKFIRHIDASPAFVDEVTQLVRSRLLVGQEGAPARLTQYGGRGPLSSWVGIAAQRTALSLVRGSHARLASNDQVVEDFPVGSDPELDYLKVRYRNEFRTALSQSIALLPARDRVILRLHVVDHVSHDRIAVMYRVNQSTVTRWIAQARDAIARNTQRILRDRLHIDTAEFESLAALVVSQLDLSLGRLLDEDRDC
jgi:RNA polymerase sigma-70 factor (ECF subfamily)